MAWIVTEKEFLMGRDAQYPPTEEAVRNMKILLSRVNGLLAALPPEVRPKALSSGYRPGHFNTKAGGAPRSGHLLCKAIDLVDVGDKLDQYLDSHPELLKAHNLWREDPKRTNGWCHLDITVRKNRTFLV